MYCKQYWYSKTFLSANSTFHTSQRAVRQRLWRQLLGRFEVIHCTPCNYVDLVNHDEGPEDHEEHRCKDHLYTRDIVLHLLLNRGEHRCVLFVSSCVLWVIQWFSCSQALWYDITIFVGSYILVKDDAIFIEEVTPVRADRAAVVQIHLARLENFNFSRWSKSFTFLF